MKVRIDVVGTKFRFRGKCIGYGAYVAENSIGPQGNFSTKAFNNRYNVLVKGNLRSISIENGPISCEERNIKLVRIGEVPIGVRQKLAKKN